MKAIQFTRPGALLLVNQGVMKNGDLVDRYLVTASMTPSQILHCLPPNRNRRVNLKGMRGLYVNCAKVSITNRNRNGEAS